ncbi:hypothetical protein PUNSTDRAFT_131806 [Punctularia strigosozonata HHB-11173 SS5]|uniref:uncharacterized protein n=1 Tax=Punctularia strigosozonata (strain HHB-11173) TaxID=741275 RepID=UPI00044172E6|nr:uncharacterized protein PUNSTDRAFT_131806 [Punctularia strigosozonata HHB-11173 SS5]EIN11647.1 hypothetical protein PUNSTDRAFT_131806 [Punctularia strigosozonata HHB-11173 SS5]
MARGGTQQCGGFFSLEPVWRLTSACICGRPIGVHNLRNTGSAITLPDPDLLPSVATISPSAPARATTALASIPSASPIQAFIGLRAAIGGEAGRRTAAERHRSSNTRAIGPPSGVPSTTTFRGLLFPWVPRETGSDLAGIYAAPKVTYNNDQFGQMQLRAQNTNLTWTFELSGTDSVWRQLNDLVLARCEELGVVVSRRPSDITYSVTTMEFLLLAPGSTSRATGNVSYKPASLTPDTFTTATLLKKPYASTQNHLDRLPILIIAPRFGHLKGPLGALAQGHDDILHPDKTHSCWPHRIMGMPVVCLPNCVLEPQGSPEPGDRPHAEPPSPPSVVEDDHFPNSVHEMLHLFTQTATTEPVGSRGLLHALDQISSIPASTFPASPNLPPTPALTSTDQANRLPTLPDIIDLSSPEQPERMSIQHSGRAVSPIVVHSRSPSPQQRRTRRRVAPSAVFVPSTNPLSNTTITVYPSPERQRWPLGFVHSRVKSFVPFTGPDINTPVVWTKQIRDNMPHIAYSDFPYFSGPTVDILAQALILFIAYQLFPGKKQTNVLWQQMLRQHFPEDNVQVKFVPLNALLGPTRTFVVGQGIGQAPEAAVWRHACQLMVIEEYHWTQRGDFYTLRFHPATNQMLHRGVMLQVAGFMTMAHCFHLKAAPPSVSPFLLQAVIDGRDSLQIDVPFIKSVDPSILPSLACWTDRDPAAPLVADSLRGPLGALLAEADIDTLALRSTMSDIELPGIERSLLSLITMGHKDPPSHPDFQQFAIGFNFDLGNGVRVFDTMSGSAKPLLSALYGRTVIDVKQVTSRIFAVHNERAVESRRFCAALTRYCQGVGHPDHPWTASVTSEQRESVHGDRLLRARLLLKLMRGTDLLPVESGWTLKFRFTFSDEDQSKADMPPPIAFKGCFGEGIVTMDRSLARLLMESDAGEGTDTAFDAWIHMQLLEDSFNKE